ncbi:MAG: FtsH protease activity modulator HflK [Myxococcales bacterium]|jgi:membrane protease subunit HflK
MDARNDLRRTFQHARALALGLVCLGAVLYLASGIYAIAPEQRGVVLRFGKAVETDVQPGIHYHLPWPFERIEKPRTTEVRTLTIAFEEPKGTLEGSTEALLTGDENLVLATLSLQYTIKAPADFILRSRAPEALLELAARDAAIVRFAGIGVDEVLTTGRQSLQLALRDDVQRAADELGLGVRINTVQIQRLDPPGPVASAFKDVGSAREDRHKLVEEARGDSNRRLPEARAQADRMRSEAEAQASEAVAFARGDADRFLAAWNEYRKAKSVTARRLYLEVIESVLPKVRKIIANPRADRGAAPAR